MSVVGSTPPVGESVTKVRTNPPDWSSSGTHSRVFPTWLLPLFKVRGVVDEDRFGDVVAGWRHRLRDPVLSRPRRLEHGETILAHDGRQDRSVFGVGLVTASPSSRRNSNVAPGRIRSSSTSGVPRSLTLATTIGRLGPRESDRGLGRRGSVWAPGSESVSARLGVGVGSGLGVGVGSGLGVGTGVGVGVTPGVGVGSGPGVGLGAGLGVGAGSGWASDQASG